MPRGCAPPRRRWPHSVRRVARLPATGVLGCKLDWSLIGIGCATGVVLIVIDEAMAKAGRMRLPPLGMGIYLPMGLALLIPVGAAIGWAYDPWSDRQASPEFAKRMGVLTATGVVVGESLFGVVFAGIFGASGNDTPLRGR